MWLHIILLAGTAALTGMAVLGKIPKQNILSKREWRLLLLLLTAGNCLGGYLTYIQNEDHQWKKEMYFERNPAGDGSFEEKMQAQVDEEEVSVYVRIPEQEGEKIPVDEQEPEVAAAALNERLEQAVADYNQNKNERGRYYLPPELDGKSIAWSRPWDTSGNMIAVLCAVAVCCIPIQKLKSEEKARQARLRQMILDYPNLITRLALLVEAGMTVRRAFERIALDYKRKRKGESRYAYEELLKSYYEMESGIMEEQAYENFGRRCGHPKYRTLATLLAQNLKRGNRLLIELLEKESEDAFEERKRYARVQGEAAATKLLLPMVLMLLIVLVILIVPACISFYSA